MILDDPLPKTWFDDDTSSQKEGLLQFPQLYSQVCGN